MEYTLRTRILMALLTLVVGLSAHAQNSCTELIPPGGAYDRIRSYLSVEKRDYLDEISYIKDFGSHDDALNFGISLGVPIFDVPLQLGGTFNSAKKDEWRKEYLNRRKHDVQEDVKRMLDAQTLNVEVVRIVADCLQMQNTGLWITIGAINDCDFSIRAGYTPEAYPGKPIKAQLITKNATCTPLPNQPLPPKGFVTDCRRTAFADAHIILHNASLGDRDRILPAVPEPQPPHIETRVDSATAEQDVSRGQATQIYGNQNCPDCQTKYGIPFAVPGAITGTRLKTVPPAFVVGCPDGGKCGNIPGLFRSADGSECTGKTTCFVWFLERNHNTPAVYRIAVDYQTTRRECVTTCRTASRDEAAETAAYNHAHTEWETMRTTRCKPPAGAKKP